ncbi:hypothetical protein MBLNU13_g08869t1 [Cladosporium sp. NU13]
MAPIIRNAMPADDLGLQRYIAAGDVATTGAMDAKTIEQQNAFQPSMAQDSEKNKNNKWFKDLALNPSHIEIHPTVPASLLARDLEPDNEPNAINCNSFGIRGGHRCQTIGHGLDIQSRIRKNHGQRHPKPISNEDDKPKLSCRERNRKGFESYPCENHVSGGGCSKIVSVRDREISPQTISNLAAVGALDHIAHKTHKPFRTMLGEYDSQEEGMKALEAHEAAIRARRTATVAGIAVTAVVCVFLLGLIFWYLRKRSKKLAAARAEGRVAELELETRRKGADVRGGQAGNC